MARQLYQAPGDLVMSQRSGGICKSPVDRGVWKNDFRLLPAREYNKFS